MIYESIYNPSHRDYRTCLDYILRAASTVDVYWESVGFDGLDDDLETICVAADALAPLTMEFGTLARARTRPWRHSVLTLPPNEGLTDRQIIDVSIEASRKIARTSTKAPEIPSIIAVHRDTPHLHTHILSIPVNIRTGERVRSPRSVAAYRSVLAPIEKRLGLSSRPRFAPGTTSDTTCHSRHGSSCPKAG